MYKKQNENKIISFIKGSSILIISNICLKAINFFLLPIYTKYLTPAMIGISDSITNFTGLLLPILTMGLDSAYSAFYFDKQDKERPSRVYNTLGITFSIIGLIPLVLIFMSQEFSNILFHTPIYTYIIDMALVSVAFNLWYLPCSLELRLQNKMFEFGFTSVIASLSMIGLNYLFVVICNIKEASLIFSTLLVNVECLVIYYLFTRKRYQKKWFDLPLLKKMFKFALPLIPMTIMMWVLSLSDRYVLLYYRGNDDVGLYGIAQRFTNVLNVVISAVSTAYTTYAYGSRDEKNSRVSYYYIFNIECILLMSVAFTISLFSKDVIRIMTSPLYKGSYKALGNLMFAQIFYAMTTVVSYGIYFNKKSMFSTISVTSAALLNLILNFALIPKYGISGASFATLIGYIAYFFATLFFSEKLYPCNYGISRVVSSIIFLYAVVQICENLYIIIRLLIWVVCMGIVYVVHKNTLKTTYIFIRDNTCDKKITHD